MADHIKIKEQTQTTNQWGFVVESFKQIKWVVSQASTGFAFVSLFDFFDFWSFYRMSYLLVLFIFRNFISFWKY